jgi:hypothetical protein
MEEFGSFPALSESIGIVMLLFVGCVIFNGVIYYKNFNPFY